MPPKYLGHRYAGTAWHTVTACVNINRRIIIYPRLLSIDRRLASEVEQSSTSQAGRWLSAMKMFYVNIIWGCNVLQ